MTVSHTKSPAHAEPRPPMSTKVDVDIAHRTGRPRALDALVQHPAVGLTALLVLTGVLFKRKRPADARRRRLITSEFLEQPGLRLTILASQSAMGSPPVDVQPPPRKTHRPRIPEANVGGCLLPARCVHADIPRHVSVLTRYFLRPCWPAAQPENSTRFGPPERKLSTSRTSKSPSCRVPSKVSVQRYALKPGSASRYFRAARASPARGCGIEPSIPRLLAMLLAVPRGRMATGMSRPATARAAVETVPSPPAATMTSVDSSTDSSPADE